VAALDQLDLSLRLSREQEAERLEAAQTRLLALRLALGGLVGDRLGPPLCVLLEGWDASGKGGAIKRLVAPLDPRHVRVKQFAAPNPDELRHHWLWRFWPALPGWGGMAVLDRSWYGRVLVERVEGLASAEAWGRAYEEIRDYERMLTVEGMVLVKLWLHISDAEQLERFEARAKDPLRDRGHGGRDEHRLRAVDARRGRVQALRARQGDRDRDRGSRGGHAPARGGAALTRGCEVHANINCGH
jgi:polyphosphate kinase 2 (PPK2 family)